MTTKEELCKWNDGNQQYHRGKINTALQTWAEVGRYSKVYLNMSIAYIRNEDFRNCCLVLDDALKQDAYMAVAWLQKGYASFMLYEYDESAFCFENCIKVYTN